HILAWASHRLRRAAPSSGLRSKRSWAATAPACASRSSLLPPHPLQPLKPRAQLQHRVSATFRSFHSFFRAQVEHVRVDRLQNCLDLAGAELDADAHLVASLKAERASRAMRRASPGILASAHCSNASAMRSARSERTTLPPL